MAKAAWLASMAPAPNPLSILNRMNAVSELAFAVNIIEMLTIKTLPIITFLRPKISDRGAINIAPQAMPNKAALEIRPSLSGVKSSSAPTAVFTIDIAVMSNPSSIFKNRHKPMTKNCWPDALPLSIMSAAKLALGFAIVVIQ